MNRRAIHRGQENDQGGTDVLDQKGSSQDDNTKLHEDTPHLLPGLARFRSL